MANVLGSLIVQLQANTAQFVSGMSQASVAARRTGREIQDAFSSLGDVASAVLGPLGDVGARLAGTLEEAGAAASKAMTAMGGLAAAGVGAGVAAAGLGSALMAAAVHAADVGAQIYEAGEKTGLAAENLSGLMAVTRETGGNFDALTTSLARATVNLTKTAESGGKTNALLYQIMGGAQGVTELGLKPLDAQLQTVIKRIFELQSAGQEHLALQQLLGKGWQENIETLRLLAEQGFGPAIEAARRMGILFDATSAREAKEFQISLKEIQTQLAALGLTIGREVIPYFQNLATGLQSLLPTLAAVYYRSKAIALGSIFDFSGAAEAWEAANKATRDGVQAQTDFLVRVQSLTEGAKAQGAELDKLTGKVHEHKTALEQAAEASRKFWELFNAGVAQARVEFPKFLTYWESFAKYQDDIAKKQDEINRNFFNLMSMGGGGVLTGAAAGLPAAVAPAAPTAVMPFTTEELSRKMDLIKSAGPSVTASLDTVRAHMETMFRSLADEGANFSTKLYTTIAGGISGIENEFAKLVTTGKSSFRELFRSLAEEIVKASISNLMSRYIFGPLATLFGGGATTGVSGNLFAPTWAPSETMGAAATSLASGGDVTPGRAYIVGEHHPEFFIPRQPGTVRPTLELGRQSQTTIVNHFNGVRDLDLFRRSESQIMTQFHRQSAIALART